MSHDAFNLERVELCGLLSTQAAITIENALLYRENQASAVRLQRSNEMLEEQVARRTAALRNAMSELVEVNDQLRREFADRSRTEAERASLQEEIIRVQNTRLAELAAPIIPITDRIVVMPLIGTIDAPRAEQVLASALQGTAAYGAESLILDVTGAKMVESDAASIILRTSAALKMLGTRVIVTGIRPDVAKTLVALGIDLSGVVICSTLKSGVAHASSAGGKAYGRRGRA